MAQIVSCMSDSEITLRLNNNESACSISIIEWERAKAIIDQFDLTSFRKFENFLFKYSIDFVCSLCKISDSCGECIIKKESGKACLDRGSLYSNIRKSKSKQELTESIDKLLVFLKEHDGG